MIGRLLLESHPQLEKHEILLTIEDLQTFFKKLRKEYTPERLGERGIERDFRNWIEWQGEVNFRFFAVLDDPDDHGRNNNWGYYTLWQCIACQKPDGTIDILKGKSEVFSH